MKTALLFIPSVAVIIACLLAGKSTNAGPTTLPASPIAFSAFDADFNVHAQWTDAQKESIFKRSYKGNLVEWVGIVSNADESALFVREKASTMTYDVHLELAKSELPKLASLKKGTKVTYRGKIENHGGAIASHQLVDGQIISSSVLSDMEVAKFLTDAEGDVYDKIRH